MLQKTIHYGQSCSPMNSCVKSYGLFFSWLIEGLLWWWAGWYELASTSGSLPTFSSAWACRLSAPLADTLGQHTFLCIHTEVRVHTPIHFSEAVDGVWSWSPRSQAKHQNPGCNSAPTFKLCSTCCLWFKPEPDHKKDPVDWLALSVK